VRAFAQTYLRCHHPVIGPEQPESKSFQLKPKAPRNAYTPERLWPALFDAREDVRRFALAVARVSCAPGAGTPACMSWPRPRPRKCATLPTTRCSRPVSPRRQALHPHPRGVGRGESLYPLREHPRSTREVAVELIRRHYARLGGPERLAWLMESADREVGLFAIRLLWEKHRPLHLPEGWKPAGASAPPIATTERFPRCGGPAHLPAPHALRPPSGRAKRPRGRGGPAPLRQRRQAPHHRIGARPGPGGCGPSPAWWLPCSASSPAPLPRASGRAVLASLVQLRAAHPGVELGGV
jgi:hypothetical protein